MRCAPLALAAVTGRGRARERNGGDAAGGRRVASRRVETDATKSDSLLLYLHVINVFVYPLY